MFLNNCLVGVWLGLYGVVVACSGLIGCIVSTCRRGAILNLVVNFMFILLWTLQGVLIEFDKRYLYVLPEQWWRIVLFVSIRTCSTD